MIFNGWNLLKGLAILFLSGWSVMVSNFCCKFLEVLINKTNGGKGNTCFMSHYIQVSALMRHMCLHRKIDFNLSQIFPLKWSTMSVILQHSGLLYCSNFVTVSVSTPWLSFKWQSWSKMRLNFYSSSNVKMPFFGEDGFIYKLAVLYHLLFNYRVVKCNRLFNFYLFLCQTFAT